MSTPPCSNPACHAGVVFAGNIVRACPTCQLFETAEDAAAVVTALLQRLATVYQRHGETVADALDEMVEPAGTAEEGDEARWTAHQLLLAEDAFHAEVFARRLGYARMAIKACPQIPDVKRALAHLSLERPLIHSAMEALEVANVLHPEADGRRSLGVARDALALAAATMPRR